MQKTILISVLFCASASFAQTPFDSFDTTLRNVPVFKSDKPQVFRLEVEGTNTETRYLILDVDNATLAFYNAKDSLIAKSQLKPNEVKFLSVDPLSKKYPELTPYQFASNTPIQGIDLDGKEIYLTTSGELLGSFGKSTSLRIVTDANVQAQIKADVSAGLTQNNKNYNSYHTSITTLNTTINMLDKAEATTKAEGFSAVVSSKDNVQQGTTGLARLSREATGNYMITPEGLPNVTPPTDPNDNQNTTIIHSHPLNAFAYSNATNTFSMLPYGTDIRTSSLFGSTPEEQTAYNANVTISPSPTDVSNTLNAKGYNWILIGNISPITYNSTTGALSPGTSGAVFYQGNISNESFRLNKADLNNLSKQATLQTVAKILSNYLNRPQ